MLFIASYFVHDQSDLYRFERWTNQVIPEGATSAALVDAGFDPASRKPIWKYPHLRWSVFEGLMRTKVAAPVQLANQSTSATS